MKFRVFFGVILIILMIIFVQATANLDNYSVQKIYAKDSTLVGTLNISFVDEPVDSLFRDILGNSFELGEILKNSTYDYICTYPMCGSFYEPQNPEETKTFFMGKDTTKVIGFTFSGDVQRISSVVFNFSSNSSESDTNQIKLDILDDGIVDMGNTVLGSTADPVINYGCFNELENVKEITFQEKPFCQRVHINETSGLFLGGWFKKTSVGNNGISMKLYSLTGLPLTFCQINASQVSSSGGEVFCPVKYLVSSPTDYYVCAEKKFGVANYHLKGYASTSKNCGFMNSPPSNEITSYKIGIKQINFGETGVIHVGDTLPNGINVSDMVIGFILDRYEADCNQGCHIPIKLFSSVNQGLTFSKLKVSYDETGLPGQFLTEFYDFTDTPSKVNSDYQDLDISNFFRLPSEEGNVTYKLFLGNEKLFEEEFRMKDSSMVVSPSNAVLGVPTNFNITLIGNLTVLSYSWDFGDDNVEESLDPKISHIYTEKGNYPLTVLVHTTIGDFPIEQIIVVNTAEKLVNERITLMKNNLENVKSKLGGLSLFESAQIKNLVDVVSLSQELSLLEEKLVGEISDSKYSEILTSLRSLKVPKDLRKVNSGKTVLTFTPEDINLVAVGDVAGKNYGDSKSNYDYVLFWDKKNIVSQLIQESLILDWEDGSKSSIRTYGVSITPREGGIDEDYYLFVKDTGAISFDSGISFQKTSNGYYYVKLSPSSNFVQFSMQDTSLNSLPFISPLNVGIEQPVIKPQEENKYGIWIFILGIFIILLIGFFIYLMLYSWYKHKYEGHLFPNRNELFNAMTYVNNSIKNNVDEKIVRKNLVKSGWKREQVNYLLRKYAGKNTGMPNLFGMKEKADLAGVPKIDEKKLPPVKGQFSPRDAPNRQRMFGVNKDPDKFSKK